MQRSKRSISMVVALIVAGLIAAVQLSACSETSTRAASDGEPATVEPIKGTSYNRVTLSAQAAERLGVQTASLRVKRIGGTPRKVIPYAAVLYDDHGGTFTYTNPEHLVFVRSPIRVAYIKGNEAVLSQGPPSGASVVTVASQELFGAEYSVEEN